MKIICLLLIALYLLSVKWRISVKLKLNSIDKEGNLCIKLFGTKIFALKEISLKRRKRGFSIVFC